MAYKNAAPQEHAYRRIDKEIKNNSIKNVLLFYGKEAFLIHWAVDTLIKKYVNDASKEMDLCKIDGTVTDFEEIRNHCETVSFLSEKRVVILRDFKLIEGGKTKGFDEHSEKLLVEYIKQIPDSCLLVMIADGADKRKKLYKAITEYGSVYEFGELDEKSLKGYIEKRFRESGKTIRSSALAQLISSSGYYDRNTDYTLYNLENDIKKAIAYERDAEVQGNTIDCVVSGNIDTDVFAMIDAVGRERKEEAYQMLHNLLSTGESEYKLIGLLCSHFELLLSVKELKEEGKNSVQMKDILGVHEFRIKKAFPMVERYSLNALRQILQKTYEIDKKIKTGLMEGSLALELYLAEI